MSRRGGSREVSRRQVLRRGAIAGAAVVWVAPVVQVIDVSKAGAQSPSAPPPDPGGGGRTEEPRPDPQVAGVQVNRDEGDPQGLDPAVVTVAGATLAATGAGVAALVKGGAAATGTGAALSAAARRRAARARSSPDPGSGPVAGEDPSPPDEATSGPSAEPEKG